VAHILLLQNEPLLLESTIMLTMLRQAASVSARSLHKFSCYTLIAASLCMVSAPVAAVDLRSATVQDINRAFDAGT